MIPHPVHSLAARADQKSIVILRDLQRKSLLRECVRQWGQPDIALKTTGHESKPISCGLNRSKSLQDLPELKFGSR